MYAVIKTGGKQYRVEEGNTLRVEKLMVDAGETFEFDQVLAVGDGDDLQVGSPSVAGSVVSAIVKAHGRHKKIKVIKFKRRKNYLRRQGHRQDYTEVEITKIAAGSAG